MTDDQELRLECLRICINVAEAKNAYFWISEQAQKQKASNLAGGLNQVNPHLNMQTFAGSQSHVTNPLGPVTHGSGTKC